MRRWWLLAATAVVTVAVLVVAARLLDPAGPWFALVAIWVPMTALGSVSHVESLALGDGFHRLRESERSGRIYERVGVQWCKRLARRGPIAVFNPGLHLPPELTPEGVTRLDARMRNAEGSHAIAFATGLVVAGVDLVLGWWSAAVWATAFNVAVNGYPVMLQRYNRVLLARRVGLRPA